MAQKKMYSRYFIILQEDASGYALASDKLPSGYTKLETKNDKCKVSYYVQNLKKEKEPYYIVLICNKKDTKKLIKLGTMNIDVYGRAEISYEFNVEDIGGSKLSSELIGGAAIVKIVDSSIVSIMSGFTNTEVPKDWKQYLMIESKNEELDLEKRNIEEEKIPEVSKVEVEARTEEKVLESKEITNIFESYENEIERLKQDNSQTDILQNEKIESKYNTEDKLINESKENNVIHQVQEVPRSDDFSKELKDSYFYGTKKEEYPNGTVGEFFKLLAEDFEEQKDSCTEIKNCRWYKVPINTLDDMCNASNYNKYTIVYYPMISYFPYIKKHNHYIIGYKYDTKGKMKYLVYGIPGTKNKADQPYSGKSGFVTWVPLREGDEREDSFGYWLMFYDFRASTIVIPVK